MVFVTKVKSVVFMTFEIRPLANFVIELVITMQMVLVIVLVVTFVTVTI